MKTKIFGAPGTGKTTKMLDLLQQELEDGTDIQRIAFVTHTVAAKIEARERVLRVLRGIDDKKDLKFFKTIHGICYNEVGLRKENVMQPNDYLEFGNSIGIPFSASFTNDVDLDGLPIGYNLSGGNSIMAARQYAAAQMKYVSDVQEVWPEWIGPDLMREVIVGFKNWKYESSKFDFVDMLEMYLNHGEPLDIDVLFIDEAQDLSKLQWHVVNKMMRRAKRVYIAGDDDQSIYAFIGADRYGFLEYPCEKNIILPITHRLRASIWDKAEKIIRQVSKRQPKDITPRAEGGEIEYWNIDPVYIELDHPGTTMVLARHHKQLQEISRDLEQRGIPYKGRGRPIAQSDQAVAVHAYFRAKIKGEPITLREAARLFVYTGMDDVVKKLRAQARENPDLLIDKNGMALEGFNWDADWVRYLARNDVEVRRNELILNVLRHTGLPGLIQEPNVSLATLHGSKGREADHVVVFTDMYTSAWNSAMRNPDDERRLAYVGVTRTREKLTVVMPETDMYMWSVV